jgi:hypothetical protein
MVRGGGFRFYVKAKMEDGRERIIREGDFDPQTMLLIEDTTRGAELPAVS